MTIQTTTPKRWRPKFSLRTLVVLVTLVCCYAACWGPTTTRGVEDVCKYVINSDAIWEVDCGVVAASRELYSLELLSNARSIPLIVQVEEEGDFQIVPTRHNRYYFWFFGYVAKLPYERDLR